MACFSDPFNYNDSSQAHEATYGQQRHHPSSWTHKLIARVAGFA
ncbi:unnamed protein product, partial [Rotaria sp. Silwood1]